MSARLLGAVASQFSEGVSYGGGSFAVTTTNVPTTIPESVDGAMYK